MQDRNQLKVSVIIPAHNSEATIVETIHSLQQQTYKEWEIIVVDDGSTDSTTFKVRGVAKEDNRIKIIEQHNQGVCSARNTGIANAQYDWLVFLDSDDWIHDSYLEKMTSVLSSDPEIDAVHCGWTRITAEGIIAREKFGPPEQDLFPVLAKSCPFAIHACMVRKSLVRAAGGFDTSLITCEDWDLWQKIARIGARFERVHEVLAFYRMRKNSLSSNGIQFFHDAITVLTRAHHRDDRLKSVNQRYPEGASAQNLSSQKLYIATWLAGYLIGSGQDGRILLESLTNDKEPSLDAGLIADNIFDAAIIPTCTAYSEWHKIYTNIKPELNKFLEALEEHCLSRDLAKRSKLNLERQILNNTQINAPFRLGYFFASIIEITQPIDDIIINDKDIERLYCILKIEGRHLGQIELPVCDGVVPGYVIKDVIASKYSWSILGKFFEKTVYTKKAYITSEINKSPEDIHNEIGWKIFLQQLWNQPDWEIEQFYDAELEDPSSIKLDANKVELIEICEKLPEIISKQEKFNVVFSIRGLKVGAINVPVINNRVKAAQLRAEINVSSGLELCKICVREALLGRPFIDSSSLIQMLNGNSNEHSYGTTFELKAGLHHTNQKSTSSNSLILGRRMGSTNLSTARRAKLPVAAAKYLIEMSSHFQEPVFLQPDHPDNTDQVLYVPEIIQDVHRFEGYKHTTISHEQEGNAYGRQHFETLFSKRADPWKYTHPYEQTKYDLTLSLLPDQPIQKALEIACAEGHFTEQLASKVDSLVAADISQVALQRAAERCKNFRHIDYQYLDLVAGDIPGKFDLIVCSEVLYYVGDIQKLKFVAQKITGSLLPGGFLLMAHANQIIDEPNAPGFDWGLPFGAKVIGETFASTTGLRLVKEIRTPLYKVQLFQRKKLKTPSWFQIRKPSVRFLDQPSPIPEEVKDSVRWNGGKPSDPSVIATISTSQLPILMYHRVAPDGSDRMSRYCVTPEAFEAQLKFLKDSGYYTVGLDEWVEAIRMRRPLPGLALVITFDDAYADFYEYAWPLLQKYGFKATVFLVSDHIGKHNLWDEAFEETLRLMDWEQIHELQQQGIEFGSHTATHRALTSLAPAEIVIEGARSRSDLYKNLQVPVEKIAYPYGDVDDVVTHLIGACGYTIALTCQSKLSTFDDDPMTLPRIEVEGHFNLKEFVERLS